MKDYESRILGKAEVRFGGKISVDVVSSKDGTIHGLAFSEFYEAGKVGQTMPESAKIHSPQVYLVFDSIGSIEIVEKGLMQVRELLKQAEERKEELSKRPIRGDIIRITHIGESAMKCTSKLKEGDICEVVSSWENDYGRFVRVRYPDGKTKSTPLRSTSYDWEIVGNQSKEEKEDAKKL